MTTEQDINALYQRRAAVQKTGNKSRQPKRQPRQHAFHLDKESQRRCKNLLLEYIFDMVKISDVSEYAKLSKHQVLVGAELAYLNELIARLVAPLRGKQPGISLPGSIPGYSNQFSAPPIKHPPKRPFGGDITSKTPESD